MATTEADSDVLINLSAQYSKQLENHLAAGETKKAIDLFQDNYHTFVKGDISSFLNAFRDFLNHKTLEQKPEIFECICNILLDFVREAPPETTILEIFELADSTDDCVVLQAVLDPLRTLVDRRSPNRGFSVMWCCGMIEDHLRRIPFPENENLGFPETTRPNSNRKAKNYLQIYKCIVQFYDYFVSKVIVPTDVNAPRERTFLIRSIIKILGHPLVCYDLQRDGQRRNEFRCIAENLVKNLNRLSNDLLKYMIYVEEINKPKKEENNSDNTLEDLSVGFEVKKTSVGLFDEDDEIPTLGLGVLYYMVIGERECEEYLPCVYCPFYIFHKGISLSSELLKCPNPEIGYKGLVLAEAVVMKVPEASVSSWREVEVHKTFVDSLQPLIVYGATESLRSLAVRVLRCYLSALDRRCQYLLLVHLLDTVTEPRVTAYLVTFIKDVMSKETGHDGCVSPYFKGRMLRILVLKFCLLPKEKDTDMIKHSSLINAVLNFIRFMVLRDKHNKTEFKDLLTELKQVFLTPLTEALKLSRAQYTLTLEQETKQKSKKLKVDTCGESEISLTVSGKPVDEDVVSGIYCALTCLDLIESLLCRVNECLDSVH